MTNKQINDTYNLPTADKLIKPTGSGEHMGKTTSKNVMSQHAVNLRFYTLNLGTDAGQLVYSLAMIILPMIPLLILIGQLVSSLVHYQAAEQDLVVLRQEVLDALDIAKLVQQLQVFLKYLHFISFFNFLPGGKGGCSPEQVPLEQRRVRGESGQHHQRGVSQLVHEICRHRPGPGGGHHLA